jgi:hypothetical protein
MRSLASDTTAADTIPMKLILYLGLLAAVLILLIQSWNTANPALEEARIKARNTAESHSPEGTMCTLKFTLPDSVRYISFGVDPDPDCNGQLGDSEWIPENNTIIYQYKNGVKKRLFLEGKTVNFIKGEIDSQGNWMLSGSQKSTQIPITHEKMGVVIEYPVSGDFPFELVMQNGVRYTMSHF